MTRLLSAAKILGICAAIAIFANTSVAQENVAPLATYQKLDPSGVTVSGISSGAFFAHQFHVAYSSLVKGVGIVAGGPYACADNADSITPPFGNPFFVAAVPRRVVAALAECTTFGRAEFKKQGWGFPDQPQASDSQAAAARQQTAGKIDDPANLAGSRVWLFHGDKDTVVPQPTAEALNQFYQLMGVPAANIQVVAGPDAQHGMPIDALASGATTHCDPPEKSYLVKCDYGAAERLLPYLYPDAAAQTPAAPGHIVRFDQTAFFDANDESASLNSFGYLYVPQACENDAQSAQRCRLHVAFHGCEQYAAKIHDLFAREAGYDSWADANNVVVLYPQATKWIRATDPSELSANPQGCWDWWGYTGKDYLGRDGTQMRAVRAMIGRLLPP
jgi:poly(3-hydroxybutyrate) depolymerase